MSELTELTTDGRLRLHFHPGQWRVWESERRFILALAGTQGGKTVMGPPWLWREIQRRGPGDYLVVTPTYPLLSMKALPEFERFFNQTMKLGKAAGRPVAFTFSTEGMDRTFGPGKWDRPVVVFFGHASDPDSLESATAKAAWLDEAGQKKFRLGSWEAIQRRLSIHQGRALITTTPYDLGWLKQKLWDQWQAGNPLIDVVRFDSTENPSFPRTEFERARNELPRWKFDLFYRAIFTRPAGLIYDCFDTEKHVCPRFAIPDHWPRYLGLDFGGVNTAGVFLAEELNRITKEPTGKFYAYREYKAGGRTAAGHADALLDGEPSVPLCVGGSGSEDQWRAEFGAAGLPVREPAITGPDSVEVGIGRVYGEFARNELFVFSDLAGLLDELGSYSRELDDAGEPTEKIADKETFHHLDALRYIAGWLHRGGGDFETTEAETESQGRSLLADVPEGVFLS